MKEIPIEFHLDKDSYTVNPDTFGLNGVAQLGVSRFQRTREPTEEHIHHGMIEIGFCMRGHLTLKVAEGGNASGNKHHTDELPITPGCFFINQPNVPHRLTSRPTGLYLYYFLIRIPPPNGTLLSLSTDESAHLIARLSALPHVVNTGIRARHVQDFFTRIFQLCNMPPAPVNVLKMRLCLLNLIVTLLELSEEHTIEASCSSKIKQVAESIRKHPEQNFKIDNLASEAALSPSHFINQFRLTTGFPPIHFQLRCRIQAAKHLLQTTDLSISEVALRLGFSSLQHFSDTFRRFVGCSPSKWNHSKN